MAGIPVVSLATTEYANLLTNGESAFINTDVDALIAGMKLLLNDLPLATTMGQHGRAVAQEQFNIERFTREWNEVLNLPSIKNDDGMKNIAFISEHASPLALPGGRDIGGQNVYVAELSMQLARKGYQIDIFTRRDNTEMPDIGGMEAGGAGYSCNSRPSLLHTQRNNC